MNTHQAGEVPETAREYGPFTPSGVPRALWWNTPRGVLEMIDQSKLPGSLDILTCSSAEDVAHAIRALNVRGAPAIGIAAAFGLALGARAAVRDISDRAALRVAIAETAARLVSTRPTAVNLAWAIRRVRHVAEDYLAGEEEVTGLPERLLNEARRIAAEDAAACQAMGALGAELIRDGDTLLTHCNAGALATGGIGTALAPIFLAHQSGKHVHVYVDETRPVLQGARLTAWELRRAGVPLTLITDNMAAHIMRRTGVQGIFVGADRVAANGDVANKIGTYGLAVIARAHGVPFYVVAPRSTVDLSLASGDVIPIEERAADEVTHVRDTHIAPEGVPVANPAFDVTPARYITAIITEAGIVREPFADGLAALFEDQNANIEVAR